MPGRPRSHLRLVASREIAGDPPKAVAYRAPQQLSLPYPDPFAVVLADAESLDRRDFVKLLDSLKPRWIFDARAFPRLDTLGGNRSHAFRLFERHGITYVDLFGRLGLTSYCTADANPAIWGRVLGESVMESDRREGPFLLLFDHGDMLTASKTLLPDTLCATLGRAVTMSVHAPAVTAC